MKRFYNLVQRLSTYGPRRKLIRHIAHQMSLEEDGQLCLHTMASTPSARTMTLSNSKKRYEEAVEKLNSLQSTSEELERLRKIEGAIVSRMVGPHCLTSMQQFMERCGITMEDIKQLPIIHVAGTKGKGSVCAFCENILRQHGLKTGLLTSPHLIEVRERIRINGKPIDYDSFSNYFEAVYTLLDKSKASYGDEMPAYNRMTTVMGLYVLFKEKVDVVILEVGCGGEYDYTNFIREPIVTGITSLGMDHLKSLGATLTKIAWHKAGIFKPGKPAFTVPQPSEAMEVIFDRAREIGTMVQCVPSLESYYVGSTPLQLGLHGRYQYPNASLAVKLCQKFLEDTKGLTFTKEDAAPTKRLKLTDPYITAELSTGADLGIETSDSFILPDDFITGLRDCYWPGRSQTVRREQVTYYLDGAHTTKSLQACVDWFLEASEAEEKNTKCTTVKILMFNLKLEKYKPSLVKPLLDCNFDAAVFCPNYLYERDNPADLTYRYKTRDKELAKSKDIKQMFESLQNSLWPSSSWNDNVSFSEEKEQQLGDTERDLSKQVRGQQRCHINCVWMPSISSAISWAACGKDSRLEPSPETNFPERAKEVNRIQVLVTGSLYLVGGVMKLLDPELAIK